QLTIEERFTASVRRLAPHVPRLFRDELKEPALPVPPRDPISNEIIFLDKDNQSERARMRKSFPEWFDYCERREKSPLSVKIDFDEQKARYEIKKSFFESYDHNTNPFVTGNHGLQAAMAKTDPVRAELSRAEAQHPAPLPFDAEEPNQTALS